MVKTHGEFCPDCKIDLEDHGHTHSGDYVTECLACPKCGAEFDYDSRREMGERWQPRAPLFRLDIEVPEEIVVRDSELVSLCELCGKGNAHYLSADDIYLCEKCLTTKRGPDGHFPKRVTIRLNPWEQQFVGGLLDYFLEDMDPIQVDQVFLRNHPLHLIGTKNMVPLVARLKQKIGSKNRKEERK